MGFDFCEYIQDASSSSFTNDPFMGTVGIEDISKGNNFISKLEERGFTKEEIEKISYKNFLGLMDKVLK